jgi:hypothetical protein
MERTHQPYFSTVAPDAHAALAARAAASAASSQPKAPGAASIGTWCAAASASQPARLV